MYSLDRKVKAAKEKGEDITPILEAARKQAKKDREKQIASCQDNPGTCAFGRDVANDAYNAYLESGFLQGINPDVARFVQQETAKDNAVIDQYASEFGKGMAVASEGAAWLAGAGVGVALSGKSGDSIVKGGKQAGKNLAKSETALLTDASKQLDKYVNSFASSKYKPATAIGAVDSLTGKIVTTSNGAVPTVVAPELQSYADKLG